MGQSSSRGWGSGGRERSDGTFSEGAHAARHNTAGNQRTHEA
jgi:hypothetical protein